MNWKTLEGMEEAAQVCLLASTPGYVYRCLRDCAAVQLLAESSDALEMFEQLERPNADIVEIAVCLMTLNYFGGKHVLNRLREWEPPNMSWVPGLRMLVIDRIAASKALVGEVTDADT